MSEKTKNKLSRRGFLAVGGAAAAATALPLNASEVADETQPAIKAWRTLGRTGFKVSDVSMGAGASDSNLIRYAYDHGINYFDTAESYGNGQHEKLIGEALEHMDRSKVFITTKLELKEGDTEQTILDRYGKCLERLGTDHADALYMHAVYHVATTKNEHFHSAYKKLKADSKVRFCGLSSHGPRNEDQESMEKVLGAAIEDGWVDLLLMSYNFMNSDEAERVLALAKKNNVGTTAMKTAPGAAEIPDFDPENPTGDLLAYIERKEEEGQSREKSIDEIEEWLAGQKKDFENTRPFREKYGITDRTEMRDAAVKWVLQNEDMHTVCVGIRDFEQVDRFVAMSGVKMKLAEARFLDEYRLAHDRLYCRHGCSECLGQCAEGLPISTIMRYSYYFTGQGRQKEAMGKYARLGGLNGARCLGCAAPCTGACPHGVDIRANVLSAHSLLTLA
jgi:predicted aldo/keto reductase-like oxidoreductase